MVKKAILFKILLLTIMLVSILSITACVYAEGPVAQVGDNEYNDFESAIAALNKEGGTLTLLQNATVQDTTPQYIYIQKPATIDFNEHDLTIEGSKRYMGLFTYSKLTLKNGKLIGNITDSEMLPSTITLGDKAELYLEDMEITTSNGNCISMYTGNTYLSVDSKSIISSENNGATVASYGNTSTIDVYGTVEHKGTFSAIYGAYKEPEKASSKAIINIYDTATLTSNKSTAILQMGEGSITVNGGTISGSTSAIAILKGNLTINDGKISSNGNGVEGAPQASNKGKVYDNGATIYIEPTENVKIEINGGTFESKTSNTISLPLTGRETKLEMSINGGIYKSSEKPVLIKADEDKEIKDYVGNNPTLKITTDSDVYYVGKNTNDIGSLQDGNKIDVLNGDVTLTGIANGVVVTNSGEGNVSVNGIKVKTSETITVADPVASINSNKYLTLNDALDDSVDGNTVVLLKPLEQSTTISINKSITLDLDKNTITLNSSDNPLGIKITKSATLTNGTITSDISADNGTAIIVSDVGTKVDFKQMKITANEGNAVTLYEYPDSNSSVTINIDEDSEIVSESKTAIIAFGKTSSAKYEINVNGTVTAKSTYSAINGSWDNPGTFNINLNGAKISGGILQMCKGDIKVTGNTSISGNTGIMLTKGTLLVEEGTKINGTGAWQEFKASADQKVYDNGAAIYIEPNAEVQVTINGGTFVSQNSAAISAPGPNNSKLTLSITNGEFTGSSTTDAKKGAIYVEGEESTGFISGGYYSSDPSKYVAEGKAAVSSDKSGFLYMIGEKLNTDLNVETEVKEPTLETNGIEVTLDKEKFEADEEVLSSIASSLANDSKVITQKEKDVEQELKEAGVEIDQSTVTVVVEPYLEIEVKGYDINANTLTLDVEAVYDLIATTAKTHDEIKLDGDSGVKNAVRIGGGTIEVKTPIKLTFALPTELQDETLYVHHTTKNGKTYVYNTEKGDGTITFTNPHGFSTFVVKTEDGVAKIEDTKYATLKEAVEEVKNNGTITLLNDCEEDITVSKEITFTLDKSNSSYSGTISAGSGYQVEKTGNDNKITYKFTKIPSSSGSSHSSGGSSKSYTIEVTVGKNGTVTPDGKVRVTQGKDRVFKINPDEGYEIDDILVDGKNVKVENTYTFENVKDDHTLEVSFKKVEEKQEENKNLYDDVLGTEWYADAVEFVTENDLMNGTGNNKFSPNTTLTRGMLVTILYRLSNANTEATSTFNDVPTTSYYSNAIAWASENKIVNGIGNNLFAPDRGVTREEMATIFDRYITAMNISIDDILASQTYADESNIANFASTAVDKMTTTGLMQGTGDNNFSPKGLATRAQTATIIMRFAERTNAI